MGRRDTYFGDCKSPYSRPADCKSAGTGHRIQITDALGHICMDRIIRGEGNVLTLGVSGLKAGVYMYRLTSGGKEMVDGKFVKE